MALKSCNFGSSSVMIVEKLIEKCFMGTVSLLRHCIGLSLLDEDIQAATVFAIDKCIGICETKNMLSALQRILQKVIDQAVIHELTMSIWQTLCVECSNSFSGISNCASSICKFLTYIAVIGGICMEKFDWLLVELNNCFRRDLGDNGMAAIAFISVVLENSGCAISLLSESVLENLGWFRTACDLSKSVLLKCNLSNFSPVAVERMIKAVAGE